MRCVNDAARRADTGLVRTHLQRLATSARSRWAHARHWLGAYGLYAWQGPDELAPSLRMEWRLMAIRWVGILVVSPALLLAHLSAGQLLSAYGVLFVAAAYNYA